MVTTGIEIDYNIDLEEYLYKNIDISTECIYNIDNEIDGTGVIKVELEKENIKELRKVSIGKILEGIIDTFDEETSTVEFIEELNSDKRDVLKFDGDNDYAVVNHDFSFSEIIIECEFIPENLEGQSFILNKFQDTGDGWGLRVSDGTICIYDDIDGPDNEYYNKTIEKDRKYHASIVLKSDGTNKLYLDGELVGEDKTSSDGVDSFGGEFYIGQRGNDSQYFEGVIGNISIWNIERNQEDLQGDIDIEFDSTEDNLESFYKADEGSGDVLTDSAGENDGTIHGAVWDLYPVESNFFRFIYDYLDGDDERSYVEDTYFDSDLSYVLEKENVIEDSIIIKEFKDVEYLIKDIDYDNGELYFYRYVDEEDNLIVDGSLDIDYSYDYEEGYFKDFRGPVLHYEEDVDYSLPVIGVFYKDLGDLRYITEESKLLYCGYSPLEISNPVKDIEFEDMRYDVDIYVRDLDKNYLENVRITIFGQRDYPTQIAYTDSEGKATFKILRYNTVYEVELYREDLGYETRNQILVDGHNETKEMVFDIRYMEPPYSETLERYPRTSIKDIYWEFLSFDLTFTILDYDKEPLENCEVTLIGKVNQDTVSGTTDSEGKVVLEEIIAYTGVYEIELDHPDLGFTDFWAVRMFENEIVTQEFTLRYYEHPYSETLERYPRSFVKNISWESLSYDITITVIDHDDNIIEGCDVTLEGQYDQETLQSTTDSDGKVYFSDVVSYTTPYDLILEYNGTEEKKWGILLLEQDDVLITDFIVKFSDKEYEEKAETIYVIDNILWVEI